MDTPNEAVVETQPKRSRLRRWIRRALVGLAAVVVIATVIGVTIWNWPTGFYAVTTWLGRNATGLSLVMVDVNGDVTPTLEGGPDRSGTAGKSSRTPVLLLHGWGTSKEAMMAQMAWLGRDRRVVAPDLPGFGDHPLRLDQEALDGAAYVEWIERFRLAAGLGKVDVLGESMGGALAAAYAAKYPQSVRRIVLEAPAGVHPPVMNAFMREVSEGKNPLRIANGEDFDRVLDLVFVSPPPVPTPFKRYLVDRAIRDLPRQEEMINAIRAFLLGGNDAVLSTISAPTLILYGSADRVTDPSMLAVYRDGIRGSTGVLIPGAGHVVFHDAPREVYREVMGFLNR